MRTRQLLAPLLLALGMCVTPTAPAHAATTVPTKVLLVVEENHTEGSAIAAMPWLASMARTYGYANNWRAITHPSLPNYLALAGGSTYGVRDDSPPSAHPISGSSVFGVAVARGKTAKTYAEGMSGNCSTTGTSRYAVKHNPWAYFTSSAEHSACLRGDVPSGTPASGNLRHDIGAGTLPTVGMFIPDLCHDAHDCSLGAADNFLKGWLGIVLNGPDYRAGRLAVIVTFDEDDGSGANVVLSVFISPHTSHVASNTAFTHYSWTRYAAQLCGTTPLRAGATAPSFRSTFHV